MYTPLTCIIIIVCKHTSTLHYQQHTSSKSATHTLSQHLLVVLVWQQGRREAEGGVAGEDEVGKGGDDGWVGHSEEDLGQQEQRDGAADAGALPLLLPLLL